jgi:hypothetical protein
MDGLVVSQDDEEGHGWCQMFPSDRLVEGGNT